MKPERDPGYREYLRTEGICCACAKIIGGTSSELRPIATLMLQRGNCDPAHTQNNGMGSKGPDSSCAPLCRRHHREYDRGRAKFEAKYLLDMKQEAEWWHLQYLTWKEQTQVSAD